MAPKYPSLLDGLGISPLFQIQGESQPYMTIEQITQWSSLIIAIGAFIVAWRKGGGEARKLEADAAGSLSGTALNLVRELEKKLENERKEYALEIENERKHLAAELAHERAVLEVRINSVETELNNERGKINALGIELETERKKRRELELRVDQLEDEKKGLISENGRLKMQLEKQTHKQDRL